MMNSNPNRAADQLARLGQVGSRQFRPHVPEHSQNGFSSQEPPERKGFWWKLLNSDRLRQQTRSEGEDLLKRVESGLATEREIEIYLNKVRTELAKYEIEVQRTVKDNRILKRAENEVRASNVDTALRASDGIELCTDYVSRTRSRIEQKTPHVPYKDKALKELDIMLALIVTRIRINAVGLRFDANRGNQREYFE